MQLSAPTVPSPPSTHVVATSHIRQPVSSGHGFSCADTHTDLVSNGTLKTVTGSLAQAIAAARSLATGTTASLDGHVGSIMFGVLQAAAGAYSLEQLVGTRGEMVPALGTHDYANTGARQTVTITDPVLLAVVGDEGVIAGAGA
ncbi:MAG: hypothetical protein H7287_01200 [Thermoleophilia bacterium]|nr:hypothetical protein [Thermoleophilia bacterium]